MVSEGTYVLLVETLRQKPCEVLRRLANHLQLAVHWADKEDSTDRRYARVYSRKAKQQFIERIWGESVEHLLAKAVALGLSERVLEMEQARREIESVAELDSAVCGGPGVEDWVGELLPQPDVAELVLYCKHCGTKHGPSGRAYRSSCCQEPFVVDPNFSWASDAEAKRSVHLPVGEPVGTHRLAEFLLSGPDLPVKLDYGEERAVQAEWAESTDERWRQYVRTEPDWNPPESEPESEPEQLERETARRAAQADAAESVGFRHLAEELRKSKGAGGSTAEGASAAQPKAEGALAPVGSLSAAPHGVTESQFGPAVELAAHAQQAEFAAEIRKPPSERLIECTEGVHSFSWRLGLEDCCYCGEPAKVTQ